jgi:DNA-binding NarL/FixJ family response regulator
MPPIRVLLADDHTLLRDGLVRILQSGGDVQVIAQAADGGEALEQALALRPDVVVTDLSMPRLSGIELTHRLHQALPHTRVLVVTMHQEDQYVLQAVRAGASGYLVKDSPAGELLAAVRNVHAGRSHFGPQVARALAEQLQHPERVADDPYAALTQREREVFRLIAEGLTTKEIARQLSISAKTAENHRARVLGKIGVRNTAELVRYALHHGLLD